MSTAERVVARWKESAGWLNAVNGTFFSLRWDRSKWELEEMANGERIPSTMAFGEESGLVAYQMPILDKIVKQKMGPSFGLGEATIREYAGLRGDDSGSKARQKLIEAHDMIFKQVLQELKEDNRIEELERFEKLLPELRRKLIWKKVSS